MCLGQSDTSVGQLAESSSEVINRFDEDHFNLRWNDLVDITYVNTIGLSKIRHPCVVVESDSLLLQEVDRAAQYAYYDLNKLKEEDWSPSVSDVDYADFVRCIYPSVEYVDLQTVSGGISMIVDSGKKVSAESSVLIDMMQCKQLIRERFLDNMTVQDDVEIVLMHRRSKLSGEKNVLLTVFIIMC